MNREKAFLSTPGRRRSYLRLLLQSMALGLGGTILLGGLGVLCRAHGYDDLITPSLALGFPWFLTLGIMLPRAYRQGLRDALAEP